MSIGLKALDRRIERWKTWSRYKCGRNHQRLIYNTADDGQCGHARTGKSTCSFTVHLNALVQSVFIWEMVSWNGMFSVICCCLIYILRNTVNTPSHPVHFIYSNSTNSKYHWFAFRYSPCGKRFANGHRSSGHDMTSKSVLQCDFWRRTLPPPRLVSVHQMIV